VIVLFAGNLQGTLINYIVINIFLLISMENNRAIYHCICTLSIVIFGKVLMRSEIGLKFIASFVVW
jgi:hypothetical protein